MESRCNLSSEISDLHISDRQQFMPRNNDKQENVGSMLNQLIKVNNLENDRATINSMVDLDCSSNCDMSHLNLTPVKDLQLMTDSDNTNHRASGRIIDKVLRRKNSDLFINKIHTVNGVAMIVGDGTFISAPNVHNCIPALSGKKVFNSVSEVVSAAFRFHPYSKRTTDNHLCCLSRTRRLRH